MPKLWKLGILGNADGQNLEVEFAVLGAISTPLPICCHAKLVVWADLDGNGIRYKVLMFFEGAWRDVKRDETVFSTLPCCPRVPQEFVMITEPVLKPRALFVGIMPSLLLTSRILLHSKAGNGDHSGLTVKRL